MANNNYVLDLSVGIDEAKSEKEIQEFITRIQNKVSTNKAAQIKMSVIPTSTAAIDNMGKAILDTEGKQVMVKKDLITLTATYENKMGDIVQEVNKLSLEEGKSVKLVGEKITLVDNVAKAEKKETAELEKQNKQIERQVQYAKEFLERTKGLKATPEVMKGTQLATGIVSGAKLAVTPENVATLKDATGQLKILDAGIKQSGTSIWSWGEQLKVAIGRTMEWASATALVYGAMRQFQQGVQYVKDLDKELTNIQAVTGMSQENVESLGMQYNDLAKSMGVSTLEISRGSLEFIRQGKSADEAGKLIKSSMMLSKLGNLDSAQSTEYLTSIMNGFKIEAQDTSEVIDKLIALDNQFATSSGEIAAAMQRSSVSAQQVGVSFEELAAMITTVSDVSRRAPESIGESFKTMFARFSDIKEGRLDEDDMGINNVDDALKRVGLTVKDGQGGFKDFGIVLKELYPIWDTINEKEQANIVKSLAGTRQRESLLILLENQTKYEKGLEVQLNSTGLALDRYGEYLDSVEASQNKFNTTWQEFWQKGINSDAIKNFYNFLTVTLNVINALGGLKTILILVTTALIAFNYQLVVTKFGSFAGMIQGAMFFLQQFIGVLSGTTVALKGTTLAMATNPVTIWIVAIGLAIAVIVKFTDGLESASEKLTRINSEIAGTNEKISSLKDKKKSIEELRDSFNELSSKTEKTEEDTQALVDVQNKLKEQVPELSGHFDNYGNFLVDATTDMDNLTTATQAQIDAENKLKQALADESAKMQVSNLLKEQTVAIAAQSGFKPGRGHESYTTVELAQVELDWQLALSDSKLAFSQMSEDGQDIFIKTLQNSGGEYATKLAEEIFIPMLKAGQEEADKNPLDITVSRPSEEAIKEAYESILKSTIEMIKDKKEAEKDALEDELKNLKDLNDAQKDYYKFELDEIKRVNDEQEKAIEREIEAQKRLYEAQKDAVEEQLAAYEKIIDNQKELIQLQKEEEDYNKDKAEKVKTLSQIESEITNLSFDTSESAIAQKLKLEEEAAKIRAEIAEMEADRTYELQVQALDTEKEIAQETADLQLTEMEKAQQQYELEKELLAQQMEDEQYAAERKYELLVQGLDSEYLAKEASLKSQIDQISEYLNQEGTIRRDAMAMIEDENSNLYQQLLDWNAVYGTGINDDIINMWKLAKTAVEDYAAAVPTVVTPVSSTGSLSGVVTGAGGIGTSESSGAGGTGEGDGGWWSNLWDSITHHDGMDSGFIGGKAKLKSNEEFSKLMKGEAVINPSQMDSFMRKTLPNLMGQPSTQSMIGSGSNIGNLMSFNISGNMDKSVIPDIERIANEVVNKLNKSMINRGLNRRSDMFST